MNQDRVKVIINCRHCGEKYTLRGRRGKDRIDTGFKQCVCNNDKDFEMITEDL